MRYLKSQMHNHRRQNGVNLTEEEDIKKRGQEYTEELYKKDLSLT